MPYTLCCLSEMLLLHVQPCVLYRYLVYKAFLADSALYGDVYRFASIPFQGARQLWPSPYQLYLPNNNLSLNVALAYLFSPSSN